MRIVVFQEVRLSAILISLSSILLNELILGNFGLLGVLQVYELVVLRRTGTQLVVVLLRVACAVVDQVKLELRHVLRIHLDGTKNLAEK